MRSVAVIGAGAFGSWLIEQYLDLGLRVKAYDETAEKMEAARRLGAEACMGLGEALRGAEAVVVAVPINSARKIIEEASRLMIRGVLAEVSSLKLPLIDGLRTLPRRLRPLSLHPLFGPSGKGFVGRRVALIPVRDIKEERRLADELMPGAIFIETSAEEHDQAMAYILTLTHLLSLAASHSLKDAEPRLLRELAGTSFKHLVRMMEAALSESPETFTSILAYNERSNEIAESVLEEVRDVLEVLRAGDYSGLRRIVERVREIYSRLGLPRELLEE